MSIQHIFHQSHSVKCGFTKREEGLERDSSDCGNVRPSGDFLVF